MKKIILLTAVIVTVFLTGCASSQTATSAQISTTRANTGISFEGFWELSNGALLLFQNRAFMIFAPDESLEADGIIFTQTDTSLTLHYIAGGSSSGLRPSQILIDYTVRSIDEVYVSVSVTWLNGVWTRSKRFNDGLAINPIPFLGYWEREGKKV